MELANCTESKPLTRSLELVPFFSCTQHLFWLWEELFLITKCIYTYSVKNGFYSSCLPVLRGAQEGGVVTASVCYLTSLIAWQSLFNSICYKSRECSRLFRTIWNRFIGRGEQILSQFSSQTFQLQEKPRLPTLL